MTRENLKNQVNSKIVNDELSEEEMMHDIMQMVDAHVTQQLILSGVVTSKRDETLELLEEIIIKVKEADNEVENGIYDPMLECAKNILNNYVIKRR